MPQCGEVLGMDGCLHSPEAGNVIKNFIQITVLEMEECSASICPALLRPSRWVALQWWGSTWKSQGDGTHCFRKKSSPTRLGPLWRQQSAVVRVEPSLSSNRTDMLKVSPAQHGHPGARLPMPEGNTSYPNYSNDTAGRSCKMHTQILL